MNFNIKFIIKTCVLFIFIFLFTACQGGFKVNDLNNDKPSFKFLDKTEIMEAQFPDWTSLNENNNAFVKDFPILEGDHIFVFKFLKTDYAFEVLEEKEREEKTIAGWQDQYSDADFIVNGAFFDEEYNATGGIILNGEGRIYSENGNNQYEGAVVINENKELAIRYLPSSALNKMNNIKDVIVNFPFLIKAGNPYLKTENLLYAQRTIIASDDNYIYFIITEGRTFTLYGIMNWILENLKTIDTALNLDGGSSSGFSYKLEEKDYIHNSLVAVPNVIVVKEK